MGWWAEETETGLISNTISKLPKNILDVLWFADGALKNYQNSGSNNFQNEIFKIEMRGAEEPSLICTTDLIGTAITPAPPLNYYPSYGGLTPDERATYLNWLCNIDAEIDIGYVFLFYYGLERWLLTGDKDQFKKAFRLIMRLRKHHKNQSFQAYSSEALLMSCVGRNERGIMQDVLTADFPLTPITLACLSWAGFYLNAEQIMKLASAVGFKNNRYIKSDPEKFKRALMTAIIDNCSLYGYYIDEKLFKDSPTLQTPCFANYSLNKKCVIPDVLKNESLRQELNDLLTMAHEQVKVIKKTQRTKNEKNIVNNTADVGNDNNRLR